MKSLAAAVALVCLLASISQAQQLVAPTEPLTPAEQQKKFKLPPGFEIQLVACEPDVHKPMNLNFDVEGRLWVTHSLEYPFPAKDDAKARDSIAILSDIGPDGRAKKAQQFGQHLNIPIGVLPLGENEALAWSIPHIYRLKDTDGDGLADQKDIVFGPYGFVDTHGNQNSFTRWLDGWIYACHGFSNHSQAKKAGAGPVVIDMQSGNTYRFRPDGSAIEQYTWGQVNPFGLAFDPLGNLFSVDCHSRPVTMLLREGYYQSFGKPNDGLGFAPEMTDMDHGGTGIAGVVYYAATQFPEQYRDVLFVGNVVTNRVHCDRLEWHGSSPRVKKIEDFITCDDPWFRPVDVHLGADGALYIADFYNKIIGHYEVPLTHPGRDRERGRIWRVVYQGGPGESQNVAAIPNLLKLSLAQLVEMLGHPNLTLRMQATNTLVDRFSKEAGAAARDVFAAAGRKRVADAPVDLAFQRAHALWVIARTDAIDEPLAQKAAKDSSRLVRVYLAQSLGETAAWNSWHFKLVRSMLADADPFVLRAAADALAKHPAVENISVLAGLRETSPDDAQLTHALRVALRDQLRSPDVVEGLPKLKLDEAQRKAVLSVAASVPSGPAAMLIYEEALAGRVSNEVLAKALPLVVKHIDKDRVDSLVEFISGHYAQDAPFQIESLRGMHEGLTARGLPPSKSMREKLTALLRPAVKGEETALWTNRPLSTGPSPSPWAPELRTCQDSPERVSMISSLPGGERATGVLRSPAFAVPPKLTFWMCGHNGDPNKTRDAQLNYARLVLADGTEIARSYPPRNDVAQRITWDLAAHAGKQGSVEVVDGFAGDAYAWLAVSRFEPPVLQVPNRPVGNSSRAEALKVAGDLKLEGLADDVLAAASEIKIEASQRLAACQALVSLRPAAAEAPLAAILADAGEGLAGRQLAAELLGRIDRVESRELLWAQLRTAPLPVATAIAASVAGHKAGAGRLLAEIIAGKAPASLLREPTVLDRLKASGASDLDKRVAALTAKLTPADDRIAKLVDQRRAGYRAGKHDPEAGRAVFARSVCANCHRVGEVGKNIGPALDGIGTRGVDRLVEDILDPNRNVDVAFRNVVVTTDAGQIFQGFNLREEDQTLVLFDNKGETVRLPLAEIDDRSPSTLSPMPSNIAEQMKEQDFYELLAYLLTLQAKPIE